MRYDLARTFQVLKVSKITNRHSRAIFGAAVALLFLFACKDSRVDAMQPQLDRLQQLLDKQGQELKSLNAAQQRIEKDLSAFSDLAFDVSNVEFERVEKAFEPLIVGQAQLAVNGEKIPSLIFVEWSLVLSVKGRQLDPISFIQRVEGGSAAIQFTHPLPRHNIKANDLKVDIMPTGWYLGHIAQVK